MTSPCSSDSRAKDWRSTSAWFFFCSTSSGSSAGSTSEDASSSSSSASVLRRRAESALWRAIASSQVETEERASKEAAWRQTSRNTSLKGTSAQVTATTIHRRRVHTATANL